METQTAMWVFPKRKSATWTVLPKINNNCDTHEQQTKRKFCFTGIHQKLCYVPNGHKIQCSLFSALLLSETIVHNQKNRNVHSTHVQIWDSPLADKFGMN